MNRDLSVYLDASRFTAAIAVILCHLNEAWVPGFLPFCTHLGLEAVGVFFVLSGFVIGYVCDGRERDGRTYLVNRAARIYSVVVPCLIATVILDLAGARLMPAYYASTWPPLHGAGTEVGKAALSLTFLNEVWFKEIIPGSNGPFWSLCFEVAYYAIFGFAMFANRSWKWFVVAAVCLVAGPKILCLAPLWLLGLGCYRICRTERFSSTGGRIILVSALVAWSICEGVRWHYGIGEGTPNRSIPTDWQFYAAGVPFAATVVGFRFARISLANIADPVRWLAGATFTLYLLHFPLGRFVNGEVAGLQPVYRWLAILGSCIVASLALAQFTERKKAAWRSAIDRAFARFSVTAG